jgi:GTP pyrophosphokinase
MDEVGDCMTDFSAEELEKLVKEEEGNLKPTKEFESPKELYGELISSVRKYHPSADITMIEKAYKVAYAAHDGQVRKSGEPYIIHPLCVAIILADLELDKETIIAGLLHDVLEDTIMTEQEIAEQFGEEVLLLVDGVTKLQHLHLTDNNPNEKDKSSERLEMQAENLRKMFLAMAKDIRVILIKLADRLHNMRTLKYQSKEGQIRIARETQEIYCPLAQRLGISKIKIELDDLSLKYLEPEAYYDLVRQIDQRKSVRDEYVQGLVEEVRRHIKEAGITAQIEGRAKHFFSIYRKMINQDKTLDQIYDLFAIRIIVDSVKDCYAALGVIHEMYKPIPGRFKDYIAMPKPNMYQSLHTTLIGPTGQPFEIQIRTYEMHRTAEYGIAAHWKYKEASNNGGVAVPMTVTEEEKLSWLRQILEWQRDMSDNKEFMSLLKSDLDLFSDMVFCFTPTGDVKNLPNGSTPIDFAYSIHSAVGNKMVGAKVNGKLVPIDYVIQNGDRIEVITSQNSKGPSRDWLNIVKSTQAKNKINQWFRSELKEENIIRGKELLVASAKAKGINFYDINKPEYQEKVLRKYGFHDWNSCLATIGHGGLKEGQIVNRMYEEYKKDHLAHITDEEVLETITETREKTPEKHSKSGIIVKGLYDVAVHFSKCCSPVPGDEIVGFVTRGRGVSIHRTDCINVINLSEMEKERLIDAEWQHDADETGTGLYRAELKLFGNNRTGLLVDITKVFTERGIDINAIHSSTSKQGIATIDVSFSTKGKSELVSLVDKLRQVESIIDIERTTG